MPVQVPTQVKDGEELLTCARRLTRSFPKANHLTLEGAYNSLTPDDIRTFLLDSPICSPPPPPMSSHAHANENGSSHANGKPSPPWPQIEGLSIRAVDLPELPLYLSTLLQLPMRCVRVCVYKG